MLKFLLINNNILKDTLRLKILWIWIKIYANSFTKTLVNNMKRKPTKVPWTLSLTKKYATPHFKEYCSKIEISLVVLHFFLSQTNVVFKYNPLFIDILYSFFHSLFTFLQQLFKHWALFRLRLLLDLSKWDWNVHLSNQRS